MSEQINIYDVTAKLGLFMGRMISSSKSYYRENHPNNIVYFNANIITKEYGKIWYGDLDLTLDAPKLNELAKILGTTIYVLSEMDGRFENENKEPEELIKKAVWKSD